jgi:radical SAM protein with 4Fe4S-binding SPASM domain
MDVTTGWITLNSRCNNRCQWCYRGDQLEAMPELSDAQVHRLIQMFSELNVVSLVFIGGEPTLKKSLPQYVSAAKKAGITEVTVVTNGRLLSDISRVEALNRAGLDVFSVSIHSMERDVHDEISGVPSWNQTYRAIENVVRTGARCSVNLVAGKANYRTILDSAKHFADMGVEAVVVTCALTYYDKTREEFSDEYSLDPHEFAQLVVDLEETDARVQIMHELPLCLIPKETLAYLIRNGKLGFGCHVGSGHGMCVNNDGHLVACNTMNFLDLGDLFGNEQLVDDVGALKKHWEKVQTDLRTEIDVYRAEECRTCVLWPQCKAGCPVVWGTRDPDAYINSSLSSFSPEDLGLYSKTTSKGGV